MLSKNKVLMIVTFLIVIFFVVLVEKESNWNWKQELLLDFLGITLGITLGAFGIVIASKFITILFK
ncbi:hypothetical protein EJM73_06320 [Clostridium botulinum]|uniref:hypothetical protein n=1 Tax=Clostridium botulinum TaxID=1491 RepID=UPI0007E19939|nr:hypothetical protein [Clostridium botulinum]KEI84137.1 hypothetical protein N493_19805 [Clostridium botulinum B2 433]NCI20866.1 hypothetical protein [Clostridium botulinum]NCI35280.1 hypothetical protein [Clostridium botulinum]NCI72128.1 hypothetical protein [Clostridium botulinum]NDI38241.1 hypothetical protein [Clostridium botulinum]